MRHIWEIGFFNNDALDSLFLCYIEFIYLQYGKKATFLYG